MSKIDKNRDVSKDVMPKPVDAVQYAPPQQENLTKKSRLILIYFYEIPPKKMSSNSGLILIPT